MESIISRFVAFFKHIQGGELWVKSTGVLVNFFWVLLLLSLVIAAFLLGRVSKFMEQSPEFSFESKAQEEEYYTQEKNRLFGKVSTSSIVASSGGKKYYFVWCKGAANIKDNKKRYFETEQAAQKAGYTLASNCK